MRKRRLVLIVVMAALCTAGLLLVFFLYDGESGNQAGVSGVRISEVMTSNKGAVPDENGNYPDWLELYNPTSKPLDISGFGLSDDKLVAAKWVAPQGTTIEAGGYLVIFCSGDAGDGPWHAGFKLSATDDLILSNASGQPIDTMQLRGVASGSSLGLDEAGAWAENTAPSPGYPNTPDGAAAYRASLSEGAEDVGVYINEFMASNRTVLPTKAEVYADWIELYNTTEQAVDLSGFGLSDNPAQPVKWKFPEGTIIPAKERLIVFCSGQDGLIDGELHAPFGLKAYEEAVVFSDQRGRILDEFAYSRQQIDISMARIPDGTGGFEASARPTPGYPNTDEGFAAFEKTSTLPNGDLYLSEAMTSNGALLPQADGSFPDWLEVYNGTGGAMDLSGYALTNNADNPAKWQFPEGTTIGPGEYLLVLATGNTAPGDQKKNLECNFRLSAEGDVALLYDPSGKLLDKLQIGRALSGMSFGRTDRALAYYDDPTPGAANGKGAAGITPTPVFETLPGIYDGPVDVGLFAGGDATIYYTDDCTEPSDRAKVYTGPISISKNTVIRAVAMKDGFVTGYPVAGTFLFKSDGVNHALPVATLVTDPKNLWDSKTGIYATGDNFNPDLPTYGEILESAQYYKSRNLSEEAAKAWERPGTFGVFDDEGREVFNQNIDLRIAGSFGRGRAQKGFNMTARSVYGKNRMQYPFFEDREFTQYKSLVLRSGAQDQNRSKIRDELAAGLLKGSDVRFLYQAYKPYVLYLNGEYWGVYFLKEKRSRFFVAQHEGIDDPDNLDLLKASTRVSHGSNTQWVDLVKYANTHDLSGAEAYQYVADRADVYSFMDYMIAEIYVGNTDTPNIQYYKLPGGKWTWIYYDFCWGFVDPAHQTLSARRGPVPAASDLFNALLKNAQWRDEFIRRFAEIMETVYAPERVLALIDELYAVVEPEIEREREKFNQSTFMGVKQPAENLGTYKGFQTHIASLRNFATKRPASMKAQIQSEFGLSDSYMREVFGE